MYGNYHPLTQRPGLSKIIWGLTLPQIVALLIGGKLSYQMAITVPPLPISNPVFARVFDFVPLILILALLYIREQRTGLLLYQYLYYLVRFKTKKEKVFIWRM
jgi:uncharacterized protein (DUF983 family)